MTNIENGPVNFSEPPRKVAPEETFVEHFSRAFAEVGAHLDVPRELREYLTLRGKGALLSQVSQVADIHIGADWSYFESRSLDSQVATISSRVMKLQGQLDRLEAALSDLIEHVSTRGNSLSTWITMVQAGDRMLNVLEPIPIVIEELDGEWMVSWIEADLSALGDDLTEAVIRFQAELMDLFEELRNTPVDNLGPLPRRWLALMEHHLGA